MSFSRAPVKRFNERSNEAPPPGHYKVPDIEKKGGVLKFEHGTERFKSSEDLTSQQVPSEPSMVCITTTVSRSSKKKLEFCKPKDKIKTSCQCKLSAEINEYKKSLIKLTDQIKTDKFKIDHLASDLQESKCRIASLQEANLRLEETQKEMDSHSDDVSEQTSRLHKIADQLRSQNTRLESQLIQNCNSQKLFQENILSEVRNATSDSVHQCLSVTNTVEDSISLCCDRIQQATLKTESLQNIIPKLKYLNSTLSKEKDDLKNELLTLRKEMNGLYQENGQSRVEASAALDKCSKLEEKIQTLQVDIDIITRSRDTLAEEVKSAHSKSDCLMEEVQMLKDKESLITAENLQLKNEMVALDSSNHNAVNELDQLKSTLKEKENIIKETNDQLQSNEKQVLSLSDDNQNLRSRLKDLEEELSHSETKYDTMETQLLHVSSSVHDLEFRETKSKVLIKSLEETNQQQVIENKAKLDEFTRRLLETQKKLNQKDADLKKTNLELAKCMSLKDEMEKQMKASVNKDGELIKTLEMEKKNIENDLSESKSKIEVLSKKLLDNKAEVDMEMWKKKYEKLEEKVKPFMDQLNAFAAEKDFMLSKTNAAEEEATKLGKKYAELLGHQNQRQKIRHVVKLKDDNFALKQEVLKLKNQVSSLQKQVIKQRKPRFDPSQAFQSQTVDNAENLSPNI